VGQGKNKSFDKATGYMNGLDFHLCEGLAASRRARCEVLGAKCRNPLDE